MPKIDLERLLNEPIYAMDFRVMIGDVEDFLDFSEMNIEWQYHRELRAIQRRVDNEGIPEEYKASYERHLEENAKHRFTVSLPLRVRYAALIALTTSVEWSVGFLVKNFKEPLNPKSKGCDETVHRLAELIKPTGISTDGAVSDYRALVHVRNCISHSAGLEENYRYRAQLPVAIERLRGFNLENWHFLGKHVWIEKGALTPYIREMSILIVDLHRAAHEQGRLVSRGS